MKYYSNRTIVISVVLLTVSFTTITTFIACTTFETSNSLCIETEKQALLNFKKSLKDPVFRLSSWNDSRDCCSWEYVVCENLTGHVREIHLRSPSWDSRLGGEIDPSLLSLKHLAHLDLSGNNFSGSKIPSFIGSLVSLEYLDLSNSGFLGIIPHDLGNLSSLRTLDLTGFSLEVDNIQWLSSLVRLEYLDLNFINLSRAISWLEAVNEMPNLIELHLSNCNLDHFTTHDLVRLNISSLQVLDLSGNDFDSLVSSWIFNLSNLVSLELKGNHFKGPIPSDKNMAKLRYLDLAQNEFNSTLPYWLFDSYSLEHLYLSSNTFSGVISDAIRNLSSLRVLDLSYNGFSGKIPWKIGNLCNLQMLYLSYNKLEGDFSDAFGIRMSKCFAASLVNLVVSANRLTGELTEHLGSFSSLEVLAVDNNRLVGNIPSRFGQLSNLERLVLDNNGLAGTVTENHFSNLSKLNYLSASRNSLNLRVREDWNPPFKQLVVLFLDSWNLGPQFPSWLQNQTMLDTIELSNTGISGEIPIWFWSLPSLLYLNLSHNQLSGEIPHLNGTITRVFLSSNNFSGRLPLLSSVLRELDLSSNSFSGKISRSLCNKNNDPNSLTILQLERNNFSGGIPDCWMNWPSLSVLNLGNNHFLGTIPRSLGLLVRLQSLSLYNNALSGRLPSSVQNCTRLFKLDLSGNKLVGNIPPWIGNSLSDLRILILRSNNFSGEIAEEICRLRFLHVLDMADNGLSGSIPSCLNNLTVMSSSKVPANFTELVYFYYVAGSFIESASLTTKGSIQQYDTILSLFNTIDLSNNRLSGSIPKELTSLAGLRSLNLSGNRLSGTIPDNIGDMASLESLDLSKNDIFGEIPIGLARLTALNYLNLSYNDLSGGIPRSTQLQSFNSSSFVGNKLCGLPLSNECGGDDEGNTIIDEEASGSGFEVDMWFYVCMTFGFVLGFLVWWAALIFKESWRYAYFELLDDLWKTVRCYVS